MSIPHLFRCPISLDLFTDPVTLCTGQTYDRPGIEKWLADGNLTCPVTMQRLQDPSLVPNHTVRHLIDQWLLTGPDLSSQRKPVQPVGNADFSLATMKQNLQSEETNSGTMLETLRKVRVFSMDSDTGQACLVQSGFFPLLLQLLFQAPRLEDSELIELALDCVLSLSPATHLGYLNMLKEASNLDSFVNLLAQGTIKMKTSLCSLLGAIATSPITQELSLIIGKTRQILQLLVSLLNEKAKTNASEAATRAMFGLCLLEPNRGRAVREGAVDGLLSYLTNSNPRNASRALATLELLLELEIGMKAFLRTSNGIHVLVKMVFRFSSGDDGSEHAVGLLLIICYGSAYARVEAVNAGVLRQLLLLLQSQCSFKAKAKARALLKLLRSMWVGDPTVGNHFDLA